MAKGKVACIVLAAGLSRRFGGPKQLFKFNGRYLIQAALDAANNCLADYVILVLGAHSDEILSKVNLGRAEPVLNKDYLKGQATSIKSGISNLPEDTDGAILMVGDQPMVRSRHLDIMIRRFRKKRDFAFVLSWKGEQRNPVLLPSILFSKLVRIRGDKGAKEVIRKYGKVRLVEISDGKVFFDVDSQRAVLSFLKRNKE